MFKSPCRNCPERRVEIGYNCHDHCKKNKAAIEDNMAQKAFYKADKISRDYIRSKHNRKRG